MRLEGNGRSWLIEDEASLEKALAYRDRCGGAQLWLSPNNADFPCLAFRISGEVGDIHFFPKEGHPGYRRLGGKGLPHGGVKALVFDGCDPKDGEETPNLFIISPEEIIGVAKSFLCVTNIVNLEAWVEL